jgi:proteasome lid subunit RPN8/RPN11
VIEPLYIPPNVHDDLIAICNHAQPKQACGLLIGESMRLSYVIELENSAPDPTRAFEINQASADEHLPRIQAEGLMLIGYFHSQPTADPVPSQATIRAFAPLNTVQLVISLKGTKPALGAWQIGENVTHVPIVFDPVEQNELKFRLSSWTQNQNIAMIIMTTLSIIALIILSIILLPPAP